VDNLISAIQGEVVRPEDAEYEFARRVYNADIDRKPLLIVQCAEVADVIHCVNYARENKVPAAVRGGGHSAPGFGTCDGGVAIDLSRMRSVRVDPERNAVSLESKGAAHGETPTAPRMISAWRRPAASSPPRAWAA
jgi:FAD/FMN-containing dehydrogenase